MEISIIVAIANNKVIGCDNKLIWHLPNDLKRFKQLTMGKPIIMGRKTWESIGKPLPGRTNIVITRNTKYDAPGANVFQTIDAAFDFCQTFNEVCIIGGGEIYNQTINLAHKLYLTLVYCTPEGDTFFPDIDTKTWDLVEQSMHLADEKHLYDYSYLDYARKQIMKKPH